MPLHSAVVVVVVVVIPDAVVVVLVVVVVVIDDTRPSPASSPLHHQPSPEDKCLQPAAVRIAPQISPTHNPSDGDTV